MSPIVVLVGVPGAGKSTVGRVLAQQLGTGFVDTDESVELEQGRPIGDIFIDDGEDAFRVMEAAAVAHAIADHDGVLAVGGGAVLDDSSRALLAEFPTVWLRVSSDAAASRVGLNAARPVLLGNVRGRMVALMKERAPLYEEIASVTVDTDDRTPESVAGQIIDDLGLAAIAPADQEN